MDNSQNYNIGSSMEGVQPKAKPNKSGRITLPNYETGKMTPPVNPYGPRAKQIYKYTIEVEGHDPATVVPLDLKYYPGSGIFRRMKQPKKAMIEARYSYKNYLGAYTLHNLDQLPGIEGFELIHKFTPLLREYMQKNGSIKFHISTRCLMEKTLQGVKISEIDDFYLTTFTEEIINETEIEKKIKAEVFFMNQALPKKQMQGSGFVLMRVLTHELQISKYVPLKADGWIELPAVLKNKKAIVNPKNTDNQCFKWAVLAGIMQPTNHPERVTQYALFVDDWDWSMLEWPVSLNQIPKFEEKNNISVNVYGCKVKKHVDKSYNYKVDEDGKEWIQYDGEQWVECTKANIKHYETCAPRLYHKSKLTKAEHNIDLLLHEQGSKQHYCWIKHFSRFARQSSDHGHGKAECCRYCFKTFRSDFDRCPKGKPRKDWQTTQQMLDEHLDGGCRKLTDVPPTMPDPDETNPMKPTYPFMHFKNDYKKLRAPFVIYADFEALTVPINSCAPDPQKSYTEAYQNQTPCGYCYHIVCADPAVTFEPVVYRGPDSITRFIKALQREGKKLAQMVAKVVKMVITDEQEHEFRCATHCHLCEKPLGKDRCRDHDHLTGLYRGAAHGECNRLEGIQRTKNWKCPVFLQSEELRWAPHHGCSRETHFKHHCHPAELREAHQLQLRPIPVPGLYGIRSAGPWFSHSKTSR